MADYHLPSPSLAEQIPLFLRSDNNGAAMAAAITAGLVKYQSDMMSANAMLHDPDAMPEWRLDEAAWEWNMAWYDHAMPIEVKREMVRRVEEIRAGSGTPGLLQRMLETVFEAVGVLEDYDGHEPYHFMVEMTGNRAGEAQSWAIRAVEAFKPLTRVLDGIIVNATNVSMAYVAEGFEMGLRLTWEADGT